MPVSNIANPDLARGANFLPVQIANALATTQASMTAGAMSKPKAI